MWPKRMCSSLTSPSLPQSFGCKPDVSWIPPLLPMVPHSKNFLLALNLLENGRVVPFFKLALNLLESGRESSRLEN